jgi:hypothetical protein
LACMGKIAYVFMVSGPQCWFWQMKALQSNGWFVS